MCLPDAVHWCDGSTEQYREMLDLMVAQGTARWLNPSKRPNSVYWCPTPRTSPRRGPHVVCSEHQEDAGPTNNWADRGR